MSEPGSCCWTCSATVPIMPVPGVSWVARATIMCTPEVVQFCARDRAAQRLAASRARTIEEAILDVLVLGRRDFYKGSSLFLAAIMDEWPASLGVRGAGQASYTN